MTLRTLLFGSGDTTASTDLGLLVLRLGVGLTMALAHGLGKIPPSPGFVENTAGMGFPLPGLFAWAAALSEFVGGLLIAVGLLTRPAAVLVATTMAVAFFLAHGGALTGEGNGELAFVYLVAAVTLVVTGAGRYSADQVIWRRTATL